MAGLPRPESCTSCNSSNLKHLFKPERWECLDCQHVVSERSQRADRNKCRVCGAARGTKPFKPKKNLCVDCAREYMNNWKKKNYNHLKEYRSQPDSKRKRKESVRNSVQKSPQAFIRMLMHHLVKKCNFRKVQKSKLNPACLDVQIDFEYLWGLWGVQAGRCALSGLLMSHRFNDLCAVSIDRKDSMLGYVPGNVQLVCQWVNRAKNNHSDDEMLAVLGAMRSLTFTRVSDG